MAIVHGFTKTDVVHVCVCACLDVHECMHAHARERADAHVTHTHAQAGRQAGRHTDRPETYQRCACLHVCNNSSIGSNGIACRTGSSSSSSSTTTTTNNTTTGIGGN